MNAKTYRIILILLILCFLLTSISLLLPCFETIPITELMPTLKDGQTALVIDGEIITTSSMPIIEYGTDNYYVLLPTKIIEKYIFKDVFLNDEENVLLVTKDKYIRLQANQKTYYENYQEKILDVSPIYKNDDMYMPIDTFKELFQIELKFIEDRNIILINTTSVNKYQTTVKKNTVIRQYPNHKSKIVANIDKNANVIIYEYSNVDGWVYVVDDFGNVGYMKEKNIIIENLKPYVIFDEDKNKLSNQSSNDLAHNNEVSSFVDYDNKINLLWYQPSSKSANPKVESLEKDKDNSTNVLCLTWFEMANTNGTIREKISDDVIDWAHNNGKKVWALMTNTFGDKEISHKVLSNVDSREEAIKELISISKQHNIDGINVDIESISEKTGKYFIEFVKELSVFTHSNNLVLSVDMYMPSTYNSFYGRAEIGKIADYYCLMAYDEHWRTSPTSGSTASIPWVKAGLEETLKVVPNKKILLGIPSYTRRWGEKDGVIVQVDALGMQAVSNDLKKNNAEIKYLEDVGQNYGEYTKNNLTYKIWIEDETSLKQRLEIAQHYKLGGVATWKKGFELSSVWELYKNYMNE